MYTEEPPTNEITKKLISHPKVIATPHIGASTKEAQIRVSYIIILVLPLIETFFIFGKKKQDEYQ